MEVLGNLALISSSNVYPSRYGEPEAVATFVCRPSLPIEAGDRIAIGFPDSWSIFTSDSGFAGLQPFGSFATPGAWVANGSFAGVYARRDAAFVREDGGAELRKVSVGAAATWALGPAGWADELVEDVLAVANATCSQEDAPALF